MYITTTVERNDEQIEIEVELYYRRGSPQTYWEPEDPDEMEIEDVICDIKIELTPDEEAKIIKLAFEKVANDRSYFDQDAPDDTYDKY